MSASRLDPRHAALARRAPQVRVLDRPAGLTPAMKGLMALILGSAVALTAMPLRAQDLSQPDAATAVDPEFGRPLSFADLARQVSPAVVNITTSTTIAAPTGNRPLVPENSPFKDFFDEFGGEGEPRTSGALGSGFVISADGYIVTNNHVIEGADEIEIEFFSRTRLPATVIGTDPNTDIALLKVDAEDLPFVPFGDSNDDNAEVGDWVMAMGNPLGQGFSISAGIISARNRELSGTFDDYIQTDAAINQGNSGGPLFNMSGEVIGVNTAILSPDGGSIGIGFAMAANVVKEVVAQLQEFGETRRGYLGVRIQDLTPDMAEAIDGLEGVEGALVSEVPPGPALDAGLQAGDVILSFNGGEVVDSGQLVRMVAAAPVGETVDVIVLRDGEMVTLGVTLGRRETELDNAAPTGNGSEEQSVDEVLGMQLAEVTAAIAEEMGLGDVQGLVVMGVDGDSDAGKKGLTPGDVITEAGQQPVVTIADLTARIDEAREAGRRSILLLVRQDGNARFVAVQIGE